MSLRDRRRDETRRIVLIVAWLTVAIAMLFAALLLGAGS